MSLLLQICPSGTDLCTVCVQIWSLLADASIPRALATQTLSLQRELTALMPDFAAIRDEFSFDVDCSDEELTRAAQSVLLGGDLSDNFSAGAFLLLSCTSDALAALQLVHYNGHIASE
jgi:hypothetical protein